MTEEQQRRIVAKAWEAVEKGTRDEYALAAAILRGHGVPAEEIERRHLESWRAA